MTQRLPVLEDGLIYPERMRQAFGDLRNLAKGVLEQDKLPHKRALEARHSQACVGLAEELLLGGNSGEAYLFLRLGSWTILDEEITFERLWWLQQVRTSILEL